MPHEQGLVVRAEFDYKSGVAGDLQFNSGDLILVTREVDDDWWGGALHGNGLPPVRGIFPKNFAVRKGIQVARGKFPFVAECPGDLSVTVDEVVTVLDFVNEDWLKVLNSHEQVGQVPANYLSDLFVIDSLHELRDATSFENGSLSTSSYSTPRPASLQTNGWSTDSATSSYPISNGNNNNHSPVLRTYTTQPVKAKYFPPPSNNGFSPYSSTSVTPTSSATFSEFPSGSSGYSSGSSGLSPGSSGFSSGMRRSCSSMQINSIAPDSSTELSWPPPASSSNISSRQSAFVTSSDFDELDVSDSGNLKRSSSNPDISEDQRQLSLKELVETERAFVKDMELFLSVFPPNAHNTWTELRISYSSIFGNIGDVLNVSKKLLAGFEKASLMSKDQQKIGAIIIDLSDEISNSYTPYCTNYEQVPGMIDQCCQNPKIERFFKDGVDEMRVRGSNIFDLGSFLIKPVQRVTRYPLLIEEICKRTADNHPDKHNLTLALIKLHEVVTQINQNKRTKEVVEKYINSENTMRSKFSKLSFHTLRKKSSRFSQSLSRKIVSTNAFVDETFHTQVEKYKNLHKTLKMFNGSVEACNQTISSYCSSLSNLSLDLKNVLLDEFQTQPFEQYQSMVLRFKDVSREHVLGVENRVLSTLDSTLVLFHGPMNLINKRNDKLLDFESLTAKLEKMETPSTDVKEALNSAKGNFMALNDQLKNELPTFIRTVNSVIYELSLVLLRLRHKFYSKLLESYESFLAYLPPLQGGNTQFKNVFSRKHCEIAAKMNEQISFITESFKDSTIDAVVASESSTTDADKTRKTDTPVLAKKPKKPPKAAKRTSLASDVMEYQTEEGKATVLAKYERNDLYTCKTEYRNNKHMHMVAHPGDLLGVKKRGSPMGGVNEWFVDNGGQTGLMDCVFLTPLYPTSPLVEDSPKVLRQRKEASGETRSRPLSCIDSLSVAPDLKASTLPAPPSSIGLRNFAALPDRSMAPRKISASPSAQSRRNTTSSVLNPSSNDSSGNRFSMVTTIPEVKSDPGSDALESFLQSVSSQSSTPTNSPGQAISTNDALIDFDPLTSSDRNVSVSTATRTPSIPEPVKVQNESNFKCVVLWSYEASTQREISLKEQSVITVLQTADLSGNSDWWLVQDPLSRSDGYYPSNYLQRI